MVTHMAMGTILDSIIVENGLLMLNPLPQLNQKPSHTGHMGVMDTMAHHTIVDTTAHTDITPMERDLPMLNQKPNHGMDMDMVGGDMAEDTMVDMVDMVDTDATDTMAKHG